MDVLELKNVNLSFILNNQKLEVLKDLSFEVKENEFVTFIGPSGCGKTTILKLLGGLYTSKSKNVFLNGQILVKGFSTDEARKKREFGFAFQNPVLLPWRNVIDNLSLPIEIIGNQKNSEFWDPYELLDLVGLSDFKYAYPRELSGGMQQRVNIARALIFKPSILLMDEPFGALDEVTREELNLELLKIWKTTNATIIFVTHSLIEAAFLGNRVLILSRRPTRVAKILSNDFPHNRRVEIKETESFLSKVKTLRESLKKYE